MVSSSEIQRLNLRAPLLGLAKSIFLKFTFSPRSLSVSFASLFGFGCLQRVTHAWLYMSRCSLFWHACLDDVSLQWCRRGECIQLGTEGPDTVDGAWSTWSSKYSECSRTCGGGVQYKERRCNTPRWVYHVLLSYSHFLRDILYMQQWKNFTLWSRTPVRRSYGMVLAL